MSIDPGCVEVEEALSLGVEEYSRMAREYDTHAAPYHAPMVQTILELADPRPREHVLDLGCGTGNLTFEVARLVGGGGSVVGIDLARGMVDVAASKSIGRGMARVRFEQMDCRELAFSHDTFDAVLSCLGIPSVGHAQCFAEVHRVLRPKGRFVYSVWAGKGTAVGMAFREVLAKYRPQDLPMRVRELLEARRRIRDTGEPKAFHEPQIVLAELRKQGFDHLEVQRGTRRMVFDGLEEYLTHVGAWGDNERELRAMGRRTREAFIQELRNRLEPLATDRGLVLEPEVRYFHAIRSATKRQAN